MRYDYPFLTQKERDIETRLDYFIARYYASTQGRFTEVESLSVSDSTEPLTNTYDALYRLKTLKDGNNSTTTYAYNSIGLPSSTTMPGKRSELNSVPTIMQETFYGA